MAVNATPPGTVGVIIVNWNGAEDTITCLRSLANVEEETREEQTRAYVVDNGSTDDSVQAIKSRVVGVEVVEVGANRGYAGGFNAGRKRALADGVDFLWLLNNDTFVEPGALAALLDAAERLGPGIYAPKIVMRDRPDMLWFAGGTLAPHLKAHHKGRGERDLGQYDHLSTTAWATGCSLLVSSADAYALGPMDEDYFLYLEDVDWCLRARDLGIPTYFVPLARISHGVSRSVRHLDPRAVRYYAWRNYYMLVARHGSRREQLAASADLCLRLAKTAVRYSYFPNYPSNRLYQARTRALLDVVRGRVGPAPW